MWDFVGIRRKVREQMQIVIDIPDDLYKSIICHRCKCGFQQKCDYENLKNAIEDGIPLPKGHGGLIDVNRKITVPIYDEQYEEWEEEIFTVRDALNRWSNEGIGVKDVVILADKAESEEKE